MTGIRKVWHVTFQKPCKYSPHGTSLFVGGVRGTAQVCHCPQRGEGGRCPQLAQGGRRVVSRSPSSGRFGDRLYRASDNGRSL